MPLLRPRVFTKPEEVSVATSPLDLPSAENYQPQEPSVYRDEMATLNALDNPEVIADTYVPVNIRIPQTLYDTYRKVAAAQDLTVEEVIQHRLDACKFHNALRGLWFSDSERNQLENIIQKWPLETAAQALSLISKAAVVKFDDVQVFLTPAQKRMLSLSMISGRSPQKFFEALVKKELRV